jgi:hypothetical protein
LVCCRLGRYQQRHLIYMLHEGVNKPWRSRHTIGTSPHSIYVFQINMPGHRHLIKCDILGISNSVIKSNGIAAHNTRLMWSVFCWLNWTRIKVAFILFRAACRRHLIFTGAILINEDPAAELAQTYGLYATMNTAIQYLLIVISHTVIKTLWHAAIYCQSTY